MQQELGKGGWAVDRVAKFSHEMKSLSLPLTKPSTMKTWDTAKTGQPDRLLWPYVNVAVCLESIVSQATVEFT